MGKRMATGGRNFESCVLSAAECGLTCTRADVVGKQKGKCWGLVGGGKGVLGETSPHPHPSFVILWLFCFAFGQFCGKCSTTELYSSASKSEGFSL